MIVEVINDMGQFFFIFLITVITFAHTFYIYFGAYKPDNKDGTPGDADYLPSFWSAIEYSYRVALGDFDTDNLFSYTAWILFIMATLFVQIMFLNLLVAIVGETFGRV